MRDIDQDIAHQFERKLHIQDKTDALHIRGKPILDLMADSSIRIPWTWRDRITLASHAARHQLDKGTLATLHMDQLADRLGFGPYMSSGPYRDIL
ncbi:hypothetical protein ACLX1H_011306 [Fusarium chlamydosporum]